MKDIGNITLILLIANGLMTYKGLKSFVFFDKFSFKVDPILVQKDVKRLFTSGFLHANWTHFLFNMISLFLFSKRLESSVGMLLFALIYFASLLGGNLFALYMHRNHGDYSAIGASGAVSGIIFACIALFPGLELGFILLPIPFPAWLFGIGYILYTILGIKSQKSNVGHEAHLGGGIIGLLSAILINPNVLSTNTLPIILILVPTIIFLYIVIRKPHLLIVAKPIPNPFSKTSSQQSGILTMEDKYNEVKVAKQSELDQLLDKISKKGFDKLSQKEKDKLDELSK